MSYVVIHVALVVIMLIAGLIEKWCIILPIYYTLVFISRNNTEGLLIIPRCGLSSIFRLFQTLGRYHIFRSA